MTRKSIIAREKKREKLSVKYRSKIASLKEIIHSTEASFEQKIQAQLQLQVLPRDGHLIRRRKRCKLTGRPRGVFRKFMVCRHMVRDLASKGFIPGLIKGSW